MIVAHVLSSFGIGGQEGMALDLATRQKQLGHVVLAVSLSSGSEGPRGPEFRKHGVKTFTVGKRRAGFDPVLTWRLARVLAPLSPDVVHTHNPRALVYGAPVGIAVGAAVVHTKHGRNPDPWRRRLVRRCCAAFASSYVAVSPTTAGVARANRECAPGKLLVIENGIDVFRFTPDPRLRAAARRELGIPARAWVIGTIGRLVREKNYPLLVRAAASLLGDTCRLVVVGDGPERSSLEREVRRSGVDGYVHLLGMRADTHRMLCALDVFALSSDTEGLPLVIPEAMASGLPIVSTAVGGIPDVLDEDVGLLVPPSDEAALRSALRAVYQNPERAARMGEASRKRALARYSSERMLSEYMDLYARVARTRGKAWLRSPSSPS